MKGFVEMKEKNESVMTSDLVVKNSDVALIQNKICVIRDVQVMLDRDLADLYHVELRVFNQAVRRNINRFPDNFMFEVDKSEIRPLITNCDLSEKMRYWPQKSMVFTEQGIAMLSAVLRSETAIDTSIRIMNAFVAMRKLLMSVAPMLARVEAMERQQLLDRQKQIADQSHNEERFNAIFDMMSESDVPKQQLFFQGQFWDAKSLIVKLIRKAKKELILIDAYVGTDTLDMLAKRNRGVKIEIITHSNRSLAESDYQAFGRQYGKLTVTHCGICHDRALIIDGKEMYVIGASLKDAGRETFCVLKASAEMAAGLLANLRNATTASVVVS